MGLLEKKSVREQLSDHELKANIHARMITLLPAMIEKVMENIYTKKNEYFALLNMLKV